LGNSGIDVSVIGHGTWQMGNDFFGDRDEAEAIKSIHASLDAGINLIDTSPGYGLNYESEITVGKAIKDRRSSVVLSTKLGVLRTFGAYIKCLNPLVMRKELEISLKNLQTDYIDVYHIHWPEYNNSLEDALQTMVDFKNEGKIRSIAVSNFSVDEIKLAVDTANISAVQPPLSLLDRSSVDNGVLPYCAKNNLGVLSYGSLSGGILAGKGLNDSYTVKNNEKRGLFYDYYNEPMLSKCRDLMEYLNQIAINRNVPVSYVSINWVLSQSGVTCALIGSTTTEKAEQNAKAANFELNSDELEGINAEFLRIMG